MKNPRSAIRIVALLFAAVFIFSLVTVEAHRSGACPWLKVPGFLEADSEFALADDYTAPIEAGGAAHRRFIAGPVPFMGRTTLLLNIYRAPPSYSV
jgi:hypothetical protein